MGGELNWSALGIVVEMLGIDDIEMLIAELSAIREWQNEKERRGDS